MPTGRASSAWLKPRPFLRKPKSPHRTQRQTSFVNEPASQVKSSRHAYASPHTRAFRRTCVRACVRTDYVPHAPSAVRPYTASKPSRRLAPPRSERVFKLHQHVISMYLCNLRSGRTAFSPTRTRRLPAAARRRSRSARAARPALGAWGHRIDPGPMAMRENRSKFERFDLRVLLKKSEHSSRVQSFKREHSPKK